MVIIVSNMHGYIIYGYTKEFDDDIKAKKGGGIYPSEETLNCPSLILDCIDQVSTLLTVIAL